MKQVVINGRLLVANEIESVSELMPCPEGSQYEGFLAFLVCVYENELNPVVVIGKDREKLEERRRKVISFWNENSTIEEL